MGVVPSQQLDSCGPYRVLLVEDELFVRMEIAATLRHAGFQVIEAACADAALEFIESGEPIDLVFTDIQTPGILDGLALAARAPGGIVCLCRPDWRVRARHGQS